jgi:hypothetical protein
MAQATLWAIVEEPTPPLAPTKAMDRPIGSALGSTKMPAMTETTSAIEMGATTYSEMPEAHQFTIEPDVVVVSDDDHARGLVADLGQPLQRCDQLARLLARFQDDEVGRSGRLVEFDRRRNAAHVHLHMGLGHAPVGGRAFDRVGHALGLAECLDRNARDRAQGAKRGDVAFLEIDDLAVLLRGPGCSWSGDPNPCHASRWLPPVSSRSPNPTRRCRSGIPRSPAPAFAHRWRRCARRQEVGRVGDLGGEVVLRGTSEIRVVLVGGVVQKIFVPAPAWSGRGRHRA